MTRHTRRNFLLQSLSVAGGIIGVSACYTPPKTSWPEVNPVSLAPPVSEAARALEMRQMPERILGRTEKSLPILGLGGSASPLSRPEEEPQAMDIIHRAIELGIRYFDTASNYGPSETYLGKVLPLHRQEVFLTTKTSRRNRDDAWRELEQSLSRLQTSYLDLWQFHALTYDWDLETLLDSQQGAIKAAEEAKEQGIIRHIGVTGHHNPDVIVKALQQYPFDTALVPINAADRHTRSSFIDTVLPVAQQQNVGIIAMKVPAYGRLFKPGVLKGMKEAMGYALSQPGVHTCIIAADTVEQLEENVAVAQQFQPLPPEELADMEQRTAAVWEDNSFFRAWS